MRYLANQEADGGFFQPSGVVNLDEIARKAATATIRQVEPSLDGTGLDIICDPAEILAMGEAWQALEENCPDTVFFQSFAWCRNFLEFSLGNPDFAPRVITIRETADDGSSRLTGILPLALQKKGRMKVLTGFAEPFQQYTDMLLDPAAKSDGLARDLLIALKKTGADYVHFGQVREDSALAWSGEGYPAADG